MNRFYRINNGIFFDAEDKLDIPDKLDNENSSEDDNDNMLLSDLAQKYYNN